MDDEYKIPYEECLKYMEEFLIEARYEEEKYYEEKTESEDLEFTEAAKEGVFKDNYYFRDHLQIPIISKELAKGRVRDEIVMFIAKFMDDHIVQLGAPAPIHKFTFGDQETSVLYQLFNTTPEEMVTIYTNMVQETYYGKISPFFTSWVKSAPHKILTTSMLVEALQKDYNDIVECCEYIFAFTEYPIIFSESWPLGVKEDVMLHTIEHLGNKFKIKETTTLQEFLKYDMDKSVETHTARLKTGADNEYMDFIYRVRNQIKNKFKNIRKAYYINDKNNATQHTKTSVFDDGSLVDQEGFTTALASIVDNTISRFSTANINDTLAGITANRSRVDKNNLIAYINQIWSAKNNRMYKFVEDVITAYFEKNPTASGLSSKEFVIFGIALYRSIGTSKNEIYREIRSILDFWMFEIINIRQFYNREATIIDYTKAIYEYIILLINHYN